MNAVRIDRRSELPLGVVDITNERDYFGRWTGAQSGQNRKGASIASQGVVVVEVVTRGKNDTDAEQFVDDRVLSVNFCRGNFEWPANEHSAEARFVTRNSQR